MHIRRRWQVQCVFASTGVGEHEPHFGKEVESIVVVHPVTVLWQVCVRVWVYMPVAGCNHCFAFVDRALHSPDWNWLSNGNIGRPKFLSHWSLAFHHCPRFNDPCSSLDFSLALLLCLFCSVAYDCLSTWVFCSLCRSTKTVWFCNLCLSWTQIQVISNYVCSSCKFTVLSCTVFLSFTPHNWSFFRILAYLHLHTFMRTIFTSNYFCSHFFSWSSVFIILRANSQFAIRHTFFSRSPIFTHQSHRYFVDCNHALFNSFLWPFSAAFTIVAIVMLPWGNYLYV